MPVRTTRTVLSVPNGEDTHLKITLELELNINLNSNGLQATVTAKDVKAVEEPKPVEEEDEGFGGFIVPTFEPSEKIEFGKKVASEEPMAGIKPDDTLGQAFKKVMSQKNKTMKEVN